MKQRMVGALAICGLLIALSACRATNMPTTDQSTVNELDMQWLMEGMDLDDAHAVKLEEAIEQTDADIESRIKLLGFYQMKQH